MTNKMKKRLAIIGAIIIVIIIFLLILKGCSKKEYTITFDTNGGNNIANVLVNKNDTLVKPEDPVKEGYEFVGWYYNDELFDFNSKITGDLVLEARWKEVVKELTGISLNATELTLKPNDTASLEVLFAPSDLTSEVEWESSDELIATVKDGKITALKEGETTITVTTKDGKFKADCKVIITKKVQEVTSVSISGKKEVYVGETIKLTANVKPKDATNKEVSWTSSNTKVATVDSKGNVKGIKEGTVKITVMTVEGEKKATITITVKEKKEETTPSTPSTPTTPSTTPSTPSKPEETPSTPTGGETKPEQPSTPSKPSTGNTPSTGETSGGNTQTEEKPKNVAITDVKLNKTNLDMKVNDTESLTLTITPNNASIESIEWKSSDNNNKVITINKTDDKKINVKAVGEGTATITVTIIDKDNHVFTKTCTIKVSSVYVITLNKNETITGVFQYDFVKVTKNGVALNKKNGEYDYIKIGDTNYGERGEIDTVLSEDAESGIATIYFTNGSSVTAQIVRN